MKHSYILLLCLATPAFTHNAQNPTLIPQIAMAQISIDNILTQANLDPIVAQALTMEVNNLTQQANVNVQQDMQEIQVAATLTSLIEALQKTAKTNSAMTNLVPALTNLKYASRANMIQKLIIGSLPEQYKNRLYYLDPYTESIGFTLNDYFFSSLFTALVTILTPTSLGKTLSLNTKPHLTNFMTQAVAGLAAYCAWLLQKKYIILSPQQNQFSE